MEPLSYCLSQIHDKYLIFYVSLFLTFTICSTATADELNLQNIIPDHLIASDDSGQHRINYQRQRVINQTLLRNPQDHQLQIRYQELLSESDPVNAATLYQQILNANHDSFDWTSSGELFSIKTKAADLFETHPEIWPTYQKLYSGIARQLFDPQKPATWRETARSYFHTPSGFEAYKRLAAQAWDEGRFGEANRLMMHLIQSPVHQNQLTSQQIMQAYMAAELTQNESAQNYLRNLITDSLKTKSLSDLTTELNIYLAGRNQQQPITWQQARQPGQLQLSADGSPPMLQPEWVYRKTLAASQSNTSKHQLAMQSSLHKWSNQQQEHLFPEITSLFAVCAKNTLVFRDFDSIRAIQLKPTKDHSEAEARWQFTSPCPTSVAFKTQKDPYTGITSNNPNMERLLIGNSVLGTMTTDNETVFLIDSIQRDRAKTEIQTVALVSSSDQKVPIPNDLFHEILSNRLVALPLESHQKTSTPRWTIQRAGWTTKGSQALRTHPLAGHFFFGPPTLSQATAYVVSEYQSIVSLTALESSTGRFLWSQPISYADRPLADDISRTTQACLPVHANGIIVCDNCNGHLIALDSTLGTLIWLHCYADSDGRQESGRWTYTQSSKASQAGVMNVPILFGNKIIILPDRSRRIQCCDLQTGQLLWSVPREQTQYLAAVSTTDKADNKTQDLLMCVGARSCKTLTPSDGHELWSTKTGIVSGHGVQVGKLFLLPVDTVDLLHQNPVLSKTNHVRGRIEAIDIATGKQIINSLNNSSTGSLTAISHPNDDSSGPLGNLLVCDHRIVSIGTDRIVCYAQAGDVIEQILGNESALSESQLQRLAQAEIIMRKEDSAKLHLQQALSLVSSSPYIRLQTQSLYREALYRDLQKQSPNNLGILSEIKKLALVPEEQAKYLIAEIEMQIKQRDFIQLWSLTMQFTELGLHVPLASSGKQEYLRTSTSSLPKMFRNFLEQCSSAERELFFQQLEASLIKNVATLPTRQLQVLSQIFSDYPQANPARLELAIRSTRQGNSQQAELILLKMRDSSLPHTKHSATQKLSELYSNLGLYTQAGRMLNQLPMQSSPQFASLNNRAIASPEVDLAHWDSRQHIVAPAKPIHHVSIRQQPSVSMMVDDPYRKRRPVLINIEQKWTLLHEPDPPQNKTSTDSNEDKTVLSEIIAQSKKPDENKEQDLTLLDRQTGQELFTVSLPGTRFGLSHCKIKQIGHLLPVVAQGTIYGLSLIQGEPIWKQNIGTTKGDNQRIEIGPVGQGFCLYQTVRSIACLDPDNGRLLWKRTDLEPQGGLWANRNTGLIGDKKTLVYFHSDQNHYTLLDTRTGEIISTGSLEQEPFIIHRTRQAFGSKLMYLAVSPTQPHQRYLRLWDPLKSTLLIDEPYGVRDLYTASKQELTILFSEGRILIYHPEQERTIANITFSAETLGPTNYLRVVRKGEHYLVNLYRTQRSNNEQGYTSRFTNSPWKTTHINGPILAINSRTGQLDWIRQFSNRTIIEEGQSKLPFVLMAAIYQNRPGSQQRTLLIEALDLKTGNTLVYRNDLPTGRLLLLNHDRNKGEVVFSGMINDIVIEYGNNNLSRLKRELPGHLDLTRQTTRR